MLKNHKQQFEKLSRKLSEIMGASILKTSLCMKMMDVQVLLEEIYNGRSSITISTHRLSPPYDVLRLYTSRRLLAEHILAKVLSDEELENKSAFEKENLVDQVEGLINDIDCTIQIPIADASRIFNVPLDKLDRLNKEDESSYPLAGEGDHVYWEDLQNLFGKIDYSEDEQMRNTFIEASQELKRYGHFKKTGSYEPDVAVINPFEWNKNPKKLKSYTIEKMYIELVANPATNPPNLVDGSTIDNFTHLNPPQGGIYITHKHAKSIFGCSDVQLRIMRSTGCLRWQIYNLGFIYPWKQLQELFG